MASSDLGSYSLKIKLDDACDDLLEFERLTESTCFLVLGEVMADDATLCTMFLPLATRIWSLGLSMEACNKRPRLLGFYRLAYVLAP